MLWVKKATVFLPCGIQTLISYVNSSLKSICPSSYQPLWVCCFRMPPVLTANAQTITIQDEMIYFGRGTGDRSTFLEWKVTAWLSRAEHALFPAGLSGIPRGRWNLSLERSSAEKEHVRPAGQLHERVSWTLYGHAPPHHTGHTPHTHCWYSTRVSELIIFDCLHSKFAQNDKHS